MPHVDLLLWVVKGDDRALSVDEHIWNSCVRTFITSGCPAFIVVNQVDKLNPVREWNTTDNRPGAAQQKLIDEKVRAMSSAFGVGSGNVIAASALERYNISTLVESIVFALPSQKKVSFLNSVVEEVKTEKATEEAERGFFAAIGDFIAKSYKRVEPYIPTIFGVMKIVFGSKKG